MPYFSDVDIIQFPPNLLAHLLFFFFLLTKKREPVPRSADRNALRHLTAGWIKPNVLGRQLESCDVRVYPKLLSNIFLCPTCPSLPSQRLFLPSNVCAATGKSSRQVAVSGGCAYGRLGGKQWQPDLLSFLFLFIPFDSEGNSFQPFLFSSGDSAGWIRTSQVLPSK